MIQALAVKALLALLLLIAPQYGPEPVSDDIVWTQSLDAWSDPKDYQEALYVSLPDGVCGFDRVNDHTMKLILCEI